MIPKKAIQNSTIDSGSACLSSIASFYGLGFSTNYVHKLSNIGDNGVVNIIRVAKKMGLAAKGIKGDIEVVSKIPLPAIAKLVTGKKQLPRFIVVYKISKNRITVMDPACGKMKIYSYGEFSDRWTGLLIILTKIEDLNIINVKIKPIKRLWKLIQPHKTILLQTLLGAFIYTGLGLATSIYIQKITDLVLGQGDRNLLNTLSLAMLGIIFIQALILSKKDILVLKMGQQIDSKLIVGYYKHLLNLPQSFFDTKQIGDLTSRVNDAVKIRNFINYTAIEMFVNIFIVIFSFTLMFSYYWKLAIVILLVIPIYSLIYFLINRFNKKVERKVMENYSEFETQVVDSIRHVRTVKEFGIEDFSIAKIENLFSKVLDMVYKSGLNSVFAGTSTSFIASIFTVLLLWIGSGYVIDGSLTTGELFSFYALTGYFILPVQSLISMNKSVQNALIAVDRLYEIMDLEREKTIGKIHLPKENIGDIEFDKVNFRFDSGVEIFENLSLKIQGNKITAVVGESGSGKTTLIALLQSLYPISSGKIHIGGYDLKHVDLTNLRKIIGVVPQQLSLFSGSIIDNIALGENRPDLPHVLELCTQLGINSFAEKLPNGLQTRIGQNGALLSGGQRQRISIARALYKNPEILLLDEATSALDGHSENIVKSVINNYNLRGKTVIIIAHRLSTVANADVILVMKNGKIVEQGKHQDLIREKKEYFHLWKRQN